MKKIIGIDIGGTKCAATLGFLSEKDEISIASKKSFPTIPGNPQMVVERFFETVDALLRQNKTSESDIDAIGISCGGPLDSKTGTIMNPPNLPGWDGIKIAEIFEDKYKTACGLQNDANACALAEWKFGAGKGLKNMVFMTFGTGLGSGLILDGKLYAGTNDNAGEIGHIRLSEFGPVGYGKSGSFEGFCSGGGIAQIAKMKVLERLQMGQKVGFCKTPDDLGKLDAKAVAAAADAGDKLALEIYAESGRKLGAGLSIIVDILNPQAIVIGSIFTRSRNLLWKHARAVLETEALPLARKACKILPAKLGENIGDYAALSVAAYRISQNKL